MVDGYTKAVLTVIAVCLAIIATRELSILRTASAEGEPMHVVVDQVSMNALNSGLLRPVPVKIQN